MHLRDGVIVPLMTPLDEREELDLPALARLTEHVIAGGVAGIFVLGSSGDGPALSRATQEALVTAVVEQASGRVPVLVGAFDVGTRQTIALARRLSALGGDAVVLVAPYYFPHTQAEIRSHFAAIAGSLDVPVVIYNIPGMVKSIVEPETVQQLLDVPGIVAIKDSLGDMTRFQQLLSGRAARPDFRVYQGAEGVAALSILRGANGAVLGLANVAPALCASLYAAASEGDLEGAFAAQERLMLLWRLHTHGQWLTCLKAAASLLGLCRPNVVAPFAPLDTAAIEAVRRDLVAAGILEPARAVIAAGVASR